ncbi:MAG: type II secretion system protein GspH [Gammaproteobacteria bacterium]|nr:MAG: type II secretion system protein GspH [Gammaproteobacteria bacterium]
MPTSATGIWSSARTAPPQAGFTLLEVLVVVFIIGVTLTLATLTVGNRTQEALEQEALRLSARLKLAGEEAVMQAREYALEFTADGYRFLVFENNEWRALKQDGTLRARRLPDGLWMKVSLPDEAAQEQPDEKAPQRIYLLSSGEMSAFEIDFGSNQTADYRLTGEFDGSIKLSRAGL